MNRLFTLLVVLAPLLLPLACPGAQTKPGAGDFNVVLRRIDVVKAGYDQLELEVIVAVENGTSGQVQVSAEAEIAIAGPGGGGEGTADASAGDPSAEAAEGEAAGEGAKAVPGGAFHKGSGAGTAPANTTSELPVRVTLPLPADPAGLEEVLSWEKMSIQVRGTARVNGAERPFEGAREVAPPHLPVPRLKSAQVAKVDGGTAGEAYFTLLLENKNSFEVTVDKLGWSIVISGKELKPAGDGASTSVPGSSVEEYNDTVELDEKALPQKELRALLTQPKVPYVIEGFVDVRGMKKPFRFAGEMAFPR